MTTQQIPRATTSTCYTNTLSPHHLHSRSTSHHTHETSLNAYSSLSHENERIYSRSHAIAGWPTIHMSSASSHPATPILVTLNKGLSTPVRIRNLICLSTLYLFVCRRYIRTATSACQERLCSRAREATHSALSGSWWPYCQT